MKAFFRIKCIFKALFCVIALTYLQGCGIDDEDVVQQKIKVNMPSSIEWRENKNFTLDVIAEGDGPLSYYLLKSDDSDLFSIDEKSGLLVSNQTFDYENPIDQNGDGVYGLIVTVVDAHQQSVNSSIQISITNVSENAEDAGRYQVKVDFPVEGANFGGFNNTLHFRGHLIKDGQASEDGSKGMGLSIQGVQAQFLSESSSEWTAEVPLTLGSHSLDVELHADGTTLSAQQFSINNNPILSSYYTVVDSKSVAYSIGSNGKTLSRMDLDTGASEVVLSVWESFMENTCIEITTLSLLDASNLLAVLCESAMPDSKGSVFIYNTVNREIIKYLPREYGGAYTNLLKWANPSELVFGEGGDFTLFNIHTGASTYFYFNSSLGAYFGRYFDVYNDRLYVVVEGEFYGQQLVSFEIPLLLGMTFEKGTELDFDELYEFYANTVEGVEKDVPFNILDGGVYAEQESVPIPTEGVSVVGEVFVSPDSSELAAYDFRSQRFLQFNLDTFTVSFESDLSEYSSLYGLDFSYSTYDWTSQELYSSISNWSGTEASSTAHIFSINTKTKKYKPLLTGVDFKEYFTDADPIFTPGQLTYAEDLNQLWFTMSMPYGDGTEVSDGLYSLDLDTNIIDFIFEDRLTEEGKGTSVLFVSDYDQPSQSAFLTRWDGGYVRKVNALGEDFEYFSPGFPFWTTAYSTATVNTVYFNGLYPNEDETQADYDRYIYMAYNFKDRTTVEFASDEDNNQLPLGLKYMKVDAKRNLIYSPAGSGLFILDSISGDRVIKTVQLKD